LVINIQLKTGCLTYHYTRDIRKYWAAPANERCAAPILSANTLWRVRQEGLTQRDRPQSSATSMLQ